MKKLGHTESELKKYDKEMLIKFIIQLEGEINLLTTVINRIEDKCKETENK